MDKTRAREIIAALQRALPSVEDCISEKKRLSFLAL
jgi:hypothetical protein